MAITSPIAMMNAQRAGAHWIDFRILHFALYTAHILLPLSAGKLSTLRTGHVTVQGLPKNVD